MTDTGRGEEVNSALDKIAGAQVAIIVMVVRPAVTATHIA
jgi:hypothetical protein